MRNSVFLQALKSQLTR